MIQVIMYGRFTAYPSTQLIKRLPGRVVRGPSRAVDGTDALSITLYPWYQRGI